MRAPELLEMAIDWLDGRYPGSVIVPELSVADWGGASIDVAAITESHIVGVEIKGEGDSPARLPLQGCMYSRVAKRMWLLPDESIAKRCERHMPSRWGLLEIRDELVEVARRHDWPIEADELNDITPTALCGTLWRDELYDLAREANLQPGPRAYAHTLTARICETLPVTEIHDWMITALRRRVWRGGKRVIDTRKAAV